MPASRQGPGLWLVTYLTLFGVFWSAAYINSIWGPLIALGSTAGEPGSDTAPPTLPCPALNLPCLTPSPVPITGVLIGFIFPGLLVATMEEDLTETQAARRTRRQGAQLGSACCAGAALCCCTRMHG